MPTAIDPRTPCLIGVARRTWHPADVGPEGAPEPLDMWEEMARTAAADAGAPDALRALDSIDVVYCQAWQYDDPAGRLAARLGARPSRAVYSGIGGTVPQLLACQTADAIGRGELDLALLVGAEALATVRLFAKAGEQPHWSHPPTEPRPFPYEDPPTPNEVAHSITNAYLTFALFDNARRGHRGTSLDEHRRELGSVLSSMTEVAAADPANAWFPVRRSAEDLITATPDNRMVAYPYTKRMVSIMDVDQAAGVLLASHGQADALGVPSDRRVYLRGWAYAQDPDHVAQRRQLWRSPSMAVASRSALASAGLDVDDLAHIDLYSCFVSSVCFAIDALGLDFGAIGAGKRPITVTGGLPYHGGPGSDYVMHSMAAMAQRLRSDPGSVGLVSGIGMHMAKHIFGLWSTDPGPAASGGSKPPDLAQLARQVADDLEIVPIVETAEGPATVATYSVLHARDGAPEVAPLVCDLPDGSRCYALLKDQDALREAEERELIGRQVQLKTVDGLNTATV